MRERWIELWKRLGVADGNPRWFERLESLYGESHRHYHTFVHVDDCLAELDRARTLTKGLPALELAIWFHDAVYDPRGSDNEERSEALADECLTEAELGDLAQRVGLLILTTKHHEVNDEPDCALMLDIDLSILGQPETRFCEYEEQVRKEFGWVPEEIFASKRAEILKKFLGRERIYRTDLFFDKYEERARRNLGQSIRRLEGVRQKTRNG